MLQADELLKLGGRVGGEKPLWTPDGSSVVYLGSEDGSSEYMRVAPTGGNVEPVSSGIGRMPFNRWKEGNMSPDGRYLAYLSTAADQTGQGLEVEVFLLDLTNQSTRQLTCLGSTINALSWAPDSASLVLSSNRYGSFDIYLVQVPSGTQRRLTDHVLYEVYPCFMPDGQSILYVRLDDTWADHEIWQLHLESGEKRLIVTDEDFFDYRFGRAFYYPLISPDGEDIVFPSQRSGYLNYWSVPVNGGEPQQLSRAEADQTQGGWSQDGRFVAFIENHNGNLQLHATNRSSHAVTVVDGAGGGVCAHPSWSPDGRYLAYLYQDPITPQQLRMAELEVSSAGQLEVLGRRTLVREASPAGLIEPRKLTYPTFDGRRISAYLYLSPAAENAPGLLWIHGGPTSQFTDTWQPDVQFFASRGYAVLLPNIRGSSGYGREFEDLNNQDWGHGDLKDVIHGAEYLKTLPQVQPEAMGIHGTSYGGCMSMSAMAFAPGYFQAAAPQAGYGNWVEFYQEEALQHVKLLDYEFGPLDDHEDVYRRCSPYFSIAHIRTPALVMHGLGEEPISLASRRFVDEMQRLYKPVRYHTYPDEGSYYVSSFRGKLRMLQDMLVFFDQYLRDEV